MAQRAFEGVLCLRLQGKQSPVLQNAGFTVMLNPPHPKSSAQLQGVHHRLHLPDARSHLRFWAENPGTRDGHTCRNAVLRLTILSWWLLNASAICIFLMLSFLLLLLSLSLHLLLLLFLSCGQSPCPALLSSCYVVEGDL